MDECFETLCCPDRGIQKFESFFDLDAVLSRLTPGRKKSLILYLKYGMNYGEIAGELRQSLSAVKANVKRARKQLREIYPVA
jgi:DNA-directed RNA polymerase specialized sigma24 family protein